MSTELAPEGDWQAEDIPLDIVFEDDAILVINKSANFVVHPAAGNYSGTVLNASAASLSQFSISTARWHRSSAG